MLQLALVSLSSIGKGELDGKVGLFPSNFTQPVSATSAPKVSPSVLRVRAMFDYSPQESNELGFTEGQIITVLEKYEVCRVP